MSVAEETIRGKDRAERRSVPVINRFINFLSSVRFGVTLLCILVFLSMVGMIIIQQNVTGFDSYYASLTPAEKAVYGYLGLFDIYHSWYFNAILLILSLNIVLASIDRFPSAWSYIASPKKTATRPWLLGQKENTVVSIDSGDEEAVTKLVEDVFRENGYAPLATDDNIRSYGVDESGNRDFSKIEEVRAKTVFGDRGKWNRIGAYLVHVALLTLFLGHFVANQWGFDADVRMIPGDISDQIQMIRIDLDKREKYNVQLPFTLECTDIQQKLIDPRGSISVTNTLDWRTQLRITDPEYGVAVADVSMNNPFSYRGYRFFQASAARMGSARSIGLEIESQTDGSTQKIEIPRLGSGTLADGTLIEYDEFLPDFAFNAEGKPDSRSDDYNNPVAVLSVVPPGGERIRVYAFQGSVAENIPVGAPKAGYKWRLADFEKVPFAHVLSIKYDPYSGAFIAWYFGGFGLIAALGFVFFFSHRRVWALVEKTPDGKYEVVLAGDANRNHSAFQDKFANMAATLRERGKELADGQN